MKKCPTCSRPEFKETPVVLIAAWMEKFREARASESRFSKDFHTLCTEAHAILGRMLIEVIGVADHEAADRACQLLAFLRDLRADILAQKRVALELTDAGASSHLNAYAGEWVNRINLMLNPPADIAVTSRAG